MLKSKIKELENTQDKICVSISLPTHRTFPENKVDVVQLKKLIVEAKKQLTSQFGKREIPTLLERLSKIEDQVNANYNLDSLLVFISDSQQDIIRLPISTNQPNIEIGNTFDTSLLEETLNSKREYLLLVLAHSDVKLYDVLNDGILLEIKNDDFPFKENENYMKHNDRKSDAKHVDNLVNEYFNKVDKALVKVVNKTRLDCVVAATSRNYEHLLSVADRPKIYLGYSKMNYNDTPYTLAKNAWALLETK